MTEAVASALPPSAPNPALAAAPETGDDKTLLAQFARLRKLVTVQTWAIGALTLVLLIILPLAQPVFLYYAMTPDKKLLQLVGLDMPNMTNRALLSWATNSVTEIMTMGFGDMDAKLPKQKWRFTKDGWNAYTTIFVRKKIGDTFKESQLVLTTTPSNTPVIIAQGVNPEQIYTWVVQMPVIMTYATNNNVTHKEREIVTLTIVRAPVEESPSGIAIQSWVIDKS